MVEACNTCWHYDSKRDSCVQGYMNPDTCCHFALSEANRTCPHCYEIVEGSTNVASGYMKWCPRCRIDFDINIAANIADKRHAYTRLANIKEQRDELLAACEAALKLLTGTGQDGTLGHHPDNPVPAMLRFAIAKARGE